MWSAGVLLYTMLAGFPPFFGETSQEIATSVVKGDYDFDDDLWDNVSDS